MGSFPHVPQEIQDCAESLIRLCSKHSFTLAGMVVSATPPALMVIRNVNDMQRDIPTLFREMADLLEDQLEAQGGKMEQKIIGKPS